MARRATERSPTLRCATYTRVSTAGQAEGDFSSIDNQREAAEALIRSQTSNGWIAIEPSYDDAGYSASTIQRPALQRLLSDIEAKHVDVVIVYKLDRLSRNQRDLLAMLDDFETQGVAFKSVTQNFDTSGPMGRAMIGMLGVFAELERGMISERTRDKVVAARRRGKWTGGPVPLGFDLLDGRLLPSKDEAIRVRAIFALYLELGSLTQTVQSLAERGWTTKSWTTRDGVYRHGKPFNVASLRRLLTNPIYVGQVRCKNEIHDGEHEGILEHDQWSAIQAMVEANGTDGGRHSKNHHVALLKGLLRCAHCDAAMTPSYTRRGAKLHRYYVCTRAQKSGWATCPTKSVKMADIDRVVVEQIRRVGSDPDLVNATIAAAHAERKEQLALVGAEIRDCERELQHVAEQEGMLAVTAGQARRAGQVARRKLDALADQGDEQELRLKSLRAKQESLVTTTIDAEALRQAIESFDPIWEVLHPREQVRVMRLLIDEIRYDGESDELAIQFAADGVKFLLDENDGEGAAA